MVVWSEPKLAWVKQESIIYALPVSNIISILVSSQAITDFKFIFWIFEDFFNKITEDFKTSLAPGVKF
jgi:hypothetical protein